MYMEKPKMEMVIFEEEDIIRTSGGCPSDKKCPLDCPDDCIWVCDDKCEVV